MTDSTLILPIIGPSDDVVLFGRLGPRVLNPGYYDSRFLSFPNGVELHILDLYALMDRTGVLANGYASTPLLCDGSVVVSVPDSSLEGGMVIIQGSNRQLRLLKNKDNAYYAVSWSKRGEQFLVAPNRIRVFRPSSLKSQKLVKAIRDRLSGIQEVYSERHFSYGSPMISVRSNCYLDNLSNSAQDWNLGTTLSISHPSFHKLDETATQNELNNLIEINQAYSEYERDELDNKFLDSLSKSWLEELNREDGVFASEAASNLWIRSYKIYPFAFRLKPYINESLVAESILWNLQYLPDYGNDRLTMWIDSLYKAPNPTNDQLIRFTDLVLQYGRDALALEGKQEYSEDGTYRPGYCLSLVSSLKTDFDRKDFVNSFFKVFPHEETSFYPESTSSESWLMKCADYGSMVTIDTSDISYYIDIPRFIDAFNLLEVLQDNHNNLYFGINYKSKTKSFNQKSYETEMQAWARVLKVNKPTYIDNTPDTGVFDFIQDYLRNDGTYKTPIVDGDEKLLRLVSTL
jgi:hypothetical protein